jgi:hypothetical protein
VVWVVLPIMVCAVPECFSLIHPTAMDSPETAQPPMTPLPLLQQWEFERGLGSTTHRGLGSTTQQGSLSWGRYLAEHSEGPDTKTDPGTP